MCSPPCYAVRFTGTVSLAVKTITILHGVQCILANAMVLSNATLHRRPPLLRVIYHRRSCVNERKDTSATAANVPSPSFCRKIRPCIAFSLFSPLCFIFCSWLPSKRELRAEIHGGIDIMGKLVSRGTLVKATL